jgi:cell division transport system ATP-binding protein
MDLFLEFNRVGVSILVASHDLGLISTLGKPMIQLSEGRLESTGQEGMA